MRSNLARFRYCSNRAPFISPSGTAAFSSGRGRGRGRGSQLSDLSLNKDESTSINPPPSGFGHGQGGTGRGIPLPSSPKLSPFSFVDDAIPTVGRGRGRGQGQPPPQSSNPSRTPFVFVKEGAASAPSSPQFLNPGRGSRGTFVNEDKHSGGSLPDSEAATFPVHVRNLQDDRLSGAGRGKPSKQPSVVPDKPKEENRHIRAPRTQESTVSRLSREEATKKAIGILSSGDGVEAGGKGERGGFRGRGGRGRGLRASRGRGGGRGRGGRRGRRFEDVNDEGEGLGGEDDADDTYDADDDDADDAIDKLNAKLGPDVMDQLVEGFEEMSSRVLPSPIDDAYVDALQTNLSIECEPEFLMEEFGTNPDIDEKPPIPLRDALEKMKPFLMAYEGIENQQEWEEVVEETMQRVPLLKEIVDYYSGPDRVTAKQQSEELERVAKTLPNSAPVSVKRFTGRAVLSLQSNPGWGFDKKCQFMDKLLGEFSQNYR